MIESVCHDETVCTLAIDAAAVWGLMFVPYACALATIPLLAAVGLVRWALGLPQLWADGVALSAAAASTRLCKSLSRWRAHSRIRPTRAASKPSRRTLGRDRTSGLR